MRCPYCGEDNPDDAIVCEHCGKALKRSNRAYIEKMREEEAKDDEAFFESDMYGSSEYNDDDLEESEYTADENTENVTADAEQEPAAGFSFDESEEEDEVEKQAAHGFSFDEGESDDQYEEILEPQESKGKVVWNRFKNYVLEGREGKKQTQRRTEEYEEEEAEKTRIFTPKDEEATRIYNPQDFENNNVFADEREDYPEEKKHHAIPYKGIVIVVAVVLVVGLVFYTKNRSGSNGSLNKSSTTTISSNPTIASVKASSSTTSTTSSTYTPDMMIDGDTATAWNVRKPYNGLGATATFTLKQRSKVKACKIMNGYDKSQLIYYRNNRIKSCTFTFDDGSETVTLKDLYNQYQTVTFSKTHTTKTVKIKINTIYHGTRYIDCAVSEISFS